MSSSSQQSFRVKMVVAGEAGDVRADARTATREALCCGPASRRRLSLGPLQDIRFASPRSPRHGIHHACHFTKAGHLIPARGTCGLDSHMQV